MAVRAMPDFKASFAELAPTRQRLDVAPITGARADVIIKQGVTCVAAAKLNRRAGVKATSSQCPMTAPTAPDFKPSSIAHRLSRGRGASTIIISEG